MEFEFQQQITDSLDRLLTDEVLEGPRAPLAGKREVHAHLEAESTRKIFRRPNDEFRLTCGARWRLLIAASFRT